MSSAAPLVPQAAPPPGAQAPQGAGAPGGIPPQVLTQLGAAIAARPGSENTPAPEQLKQAVVTAQMAHGEQAMEPANQAVDDTAQGMGQILDKQDSQNKQLLGEQKRLDAKEAVAEAPFYEKYNAVTDKFEQQFSAARDLTLKQTKEALDSYMGTVNQYSGTHVYNWWAEASTGSKILGLISQVFAGAAQGLTHSMGAATPMDRIIEQDLAVQRLKVDVAGQKVAQSRGLYNDLLGQFKDQVTSENALREIAYNSVIKRADIIAKQNGYDKQQGYIKWREEMVNKGAQNRANALMTLGQMKQQSAFHSAAAQQSYDSMWLSHNDKEREMSDNEINNGTTIDLPGLPGSRTLGKEGKEKLKVSITGINSAIQAAKQLKDNLTGVVTDKDGNAQLDKSGNPIRRNQTENPMEFIRQNQALVAQIVFANKDALNLRGLQGESVDQVEKALGADQDLKAQVIRKLGLDGGYDAAARHIDRFIAGMKMMRATKVRGAVNPTTGKPFELSADYDKQMGTE